MNTIPAFLTALALSTALCDLTLAASRFTTGKLFDAQRVAKAWSLATDWRFWTDTFTRGVPMRAASR